MKLILQIAAGVVLGGILLDLAHFLEGAAALHAAAEALTSSDALPLWHVPQHEPPPVILRADPPATEAPPQKPCEVRNAKGEVFRC